jgi:hypothetical protein
MPDFDSECNNAIRFYASLVRVVEAAPIENNPRVFSLMARSGAADVVGFRQNTIDGLWHVADATGVLRLLGTTSMQDSIASGLAKAER